MFKSLHSRFADPELDARKLQLDKKRAAVTKLSQATNRVGPAQQALASAYVELGARLREFTETQSGAYCLLPHLLRAVHCLLPHLLTVSLGHGLIVSLPTISLTHSLTVFIRSISPLTCQVCRR